MTVAEVLARSAIDQVRLLGSAPPPAGDLQLQTRDHVRPSFQQGQLILTVEWAAGHTLVPFETPTPTPCCADHART